MEVTYNAIKHLVYREKETDGTMFCEFKDPDSENIIKSQARVNRIDTKDKQVEHVVHTQAYYFFRSTVMETLYKVLGTGVIGNTVRQVVYRIFPSSPAPNPSDRPYTTYELQQATIEAFKRVSSGFYFDGDYWRIKRSMSPFEEVLDKNPIVKKYDRKVLAQMLVELANVDGAMTPSERNFIDGFLSADIGSINSLLAEEPLSAVDIEEISPNVRESFLLLAWSMALTDKKMSAQEKSKLNDYAVMLNLSAKRIDELITMAKDNIVEMAVSSGLDNAALNQLAANIEMNPDDMRRAKIRYEKRTS